MRHILVINSKGGSGKSTIATNIASYFATEGNRVSLADFDPQKSSLDWLAQRPKDRPLITGIDADADGLKHLSRASDVLVMDAPAGVYGPELTALVNRSDTIIIPVLPSPIDMKATAKFVVNLKETYHVANKRAKLAVIANRIKEHTIIYEQLDEFLAKLRVPYLTALRDAQNYNRAYTRGLGVFELPEYLAWPDWEQWDPITRWLRSKRSQPTV